MGSLTRLQIVTRGLQLAGAPNNIAPRINEHLNSWLRSQYAALDWPFLTRRKTAVALSTGATGVVFGAGNSGITEQVRRVIDPIRLYRSDFTHRSNMRVSTVFGGSLEDDETVNNPATHRGLPTRCKVKPHESIQGAFNIIPNVFPDRDLLMAVDYVVVPDDIDVTTAGDATKPVYPNDRTLIQAAKYLGLDYEKKPEARDELEILGGMVGDDKLKYGAMPGINQTWGLDPNTYR